MYYEFVLIKSSMHINKVQRPLEPLGNKIGITQEKSRVVLHYFKDFTEIHS